MLELCLGLLGDDVTFEGNLPLWKSMLSCKGLHDLFPLSRDFTLLVDMLKMV